MNTLTNKTRLAAAYFVIITLILSFLPQVGIVKADSEITYQQTSSVQSKSLDTRALILHDYLASKGSPLADYSQDFIDAADQNGVDWKLVPAISGVESTFGQAEPAGSYNAWGVGGSNLVYYKSWSAAIFTLNQYLKQNYINKGLTTPYQINSVYAASPTWGTRVSGFMADMDQYSKKYNQNLQNSELNSVLSLNQTQPKPSTAPIPTVIALK